MNKKKPSRRRLTTLVDVRSFLSGIINQLNRDEIDENKASKVDYLCQILSKVMTQGDLERRVPELEEHLLGGE